MTKTLAQINGRLAEIDSELAELAKTDHDALMAQAVVNGADVDQVEANQAQAERRARHLRLEHETLTSMIPGAKRAEAAPAIAKLKKAHAAKVTESVEVVSEALRHWEALQAYLVRFQTLRSEADKLTIEARSLALSAGDADPIADMGMPVSRQLSQAGEIMGYRGRELQMWASMGSRNETGLFGPNVDPQAKGVAA